MSTKNADWQAFADLRTQLARLHGLGASASLESLVDELTKLPTPVSVDDARAQTTEGLMSRAELATMRADTKVEGGAFTRGEVESLLDHVDILQREHTIECDRLMGHVDGYTEQLEALDNPPRLAWHCCEPGCDKPVCVRIFDTREPEDSSESHACKDHASKFGSGERWTRWEPVPVDSHAFEWSDADHEYRSSECSVEIDCEGPWVVSSQYDGLDEYHNATAIDAAAVMAVLVKTYGREGVASWAFTVEL